MRIIVPFIVLVMSYGSLDKIALQMPRRDFENDRPIFRKIFYPPGVYLIVQKTRKEMRMGELEPTLPGYVLREQIETISPEKRLRVLRAYLEHLNSDLKTPIVLKWTDSEYLAYALYIYGSLYIDPGVLRVLFRFARNMESDLKSASEIVKYFQTRYPDGRFDYLTPEYISDWYETLLSGQLLAPVDASTRARIEENDHSMYGDVSLAIRIEHTRMRILIQNRYNRLRKTGYDIVL